MHVGADGFDGGTLPRVQARGQQPGQAGLGTIWREADDLIDGVSECRGGLVRKAIDEVHIDAIEAKMARGLD